MVQKGGMSFDYTRRRHPGPESPCSREEKVLEESEGVTTAMNRSKKTLAALILVLVMFPGTVAARDVTLTWLVHDHATMLDAWKGIIDSYRVENPNVTVELTVVPGGAAYNERMAVMAASGVLPDIIYLINPSLIESGNILELTPLYDRDPEIPLLKSSWLPGVWEHSAHGEQRYMMPVAIAMQVAYLNTDHFSEGGIALPSDDWTWNEFLEVTKRLTRYGSQAVEQWGLERPTASNLSGEVLPFVYEAGGRFFDDQYAPTQSYFTDEEVIEGLSFLHSLRWLHHVTPQPREPNLTFINGGASIRLHWPARIAQFAQVPDLKWEIRRMPQYRERATVAGYDGLYINANTNHVDVAWDFVKYVTTSSAQSLYAPHGQIPISRDVVLSAEWLNSPIPGLNKEAFSSEAAVAYNRQIRPKYDEDINRIFAEEWRKAWETNEQAVESVAAEVHRRVTALLQANQ